MRKNFVDLAFILVFYFTQTLTTLSLNGNGIGDKGAGYLGEALRRNTVREKLFRYLSCSIVCYFKQALTTLCLGTNWINDEGAEYLSEALRRNAVSVKESTCLIFDSCFLFHTDT